MVESLNSYTKKILFRSIIPSSSKIKGSPRTRNLPLIPQSLQPNRGERHQPVTNRNSPEFLRVTGPSEKPRFPIPFFLPLFPLMHNSVVFEFPEDGAFLKEERYYTLEAVSLSERRRRKKKERERREKRREGRINSREERETEGGFTLPLTPGYSPRTIP